MHPRRHMVLSPSPLAPILIATLASLPALSVTAGDAPGARDGRNESAFIVYLGLDVAVEAAGRSFPIVAARDRSFTILRNGSRENIPAADAEFKMTREPKLSGVQVTIEQLTGVPVDDPRTDPNREAMQKQLALDAVQADQQDLATAAAVQAAADAEAITRLASDPTSGVTQTQVQTANAAANSAAAKMDRAYAAPMFGSILPGSGTRGPATHDAFEVSFRISTPAKLENAFGLLVLIIRSPDTPNVPASVLRFFPLRGDLADGRKIRVTQTGLPRGFTTDSYAVHVYAGGQEVPSNLSPNRMELSAAEAHQFLALRHAQVNSSATMPAQIAHELVPAEVRTWAVQAAENRAVSLAIDRDGHVTAVRLEAEVDSASEAALKQQWMRVPFLPALVRGVPTGSEGTFASSELAPR